MASAPTAADYPYYSVSAVIAILSAGAVILDIPPLVWHFSQRNLPACSLMIWLIIINTFSLINALIWPRDNIQDWWNGPGLCDVEARVFVGCSVAQAAAVTMILRKLARVMDTSNITVRTSRGQRIRDTTMEVLWCWGAPVLMMLVYYVVQPFRYYIFAISGCVAAFDSSWPSIILSWIWGPIVMIWASYYAILLIYRLHIYRREFSRLITTRHTTKSRFIRLFIMCMIILLAYLPYLTFVTYTNASAIVDDYRWSAVHGPGWNAVVKVPTAGQVRYDVWGKIITGYVAFFIFGIGSDASDTYKRILCTFGLGKVFPNLERRNNENGGSSPTLMKRGWRSLESRSKSILSRKTSSCVTDAQPTSSRIGSIATSATPRSQFATLYQSTTNESILPCVAERPTTFESQPVVLQPKRASFFSRIFRRSGSRSPELPLAMQETLDELTDTSMSATTTSPVFPKDWSVVPASAIDGECSQIVVESKLPFHHVCNLEKLDDSDIV